MDRISYVFPPLKRQDGQETEQDGQGMDSGWTQDGQRMYKAQAAGWTRFPTFFHPLNTRMGRE